MDKIFNIVPLNPFSFNGDKPDWYYFNHAAEKCYYQLFETGDTTMFQILSEVEDFTATIIDFETNETVKNLIPVNQETNVIGQDFEVYNVTVNFSDVPEGYYYILVEWNDGGQRELYSKPIHLLENHEGTLLFEYKNSRNDFSVIFTEDTVFHLRVEGTIQNFEPSSDDEIYNDQKRNATLLSSTPYRLFKLFVGDAKGIPDWMADIVNRIMSCDTVKIDGHFFNKEEGATWEVNRFDEYPFSGLSIEIQPTFNLFNEEFDIEDEDDEEGTRKVILRRSRNFFDIGGSFQIDNIFKDKTVLDYIVAYRNSGAPYVLKVGLTEGGSEIGEFNIDDNAHIQTIRWAFNEPRILYLSGMNGSNDYHIVWEQLNEEGGGTGGGGGLPNPYPELGINATVVYAGDEALIQVDFDMNTGLGREESEWYGWALCDGRNGTINMGGRFPIGANNNYNALSTGGEENVTLETNQQGTFGIRAMRDRSAGTASIRQIRSLQLRPSGGSWNQVPESGTPLAWGGELTVRLSDANQSHNNMPPYIGAYWVQKIQ